MKRILLAVFFLLFSMTAFSATTDAALVRKDSGFVSPEGDFTALFTIRVRGYAEPKTEWPSGMIASCRGGYYDGWRLKIVREEGVPAFEIGTLAGGLSIEGDGPVSLGRWHRMGASWVRSVEDPEKGTMSLWLDGRLVASRADAPRPILDGSPILLGYTDYGVGALHVEIPRSSCVGRALEPGEILQDFASEPDCGGVADEDEAPLLWQVYHRGLSIARRAQASADQVPDHPEAQTVLTVGATEEERSDASTALRRALEKASKAEKPAAIEFATGCYRFTETVDIEGDAFDGLQLRAQDGATVEFLGSRGIPLAEFARPTDSAVLGRFPDAVRGRIVSARVLLPFAREAWGYDKGTDETKHGILLADGEGNLLAQSRWPRTGFVAAQKVSDTVFRLPGEAPAALSSAESSCAYGYWRYRWADECLPVARQEDGSFRLESPASFGLSDEPWIALLGAPGAMAEPGDWCALDGILHLIPTEGMESVSVPELQGPFLRFRNVVAPRISGISLTGGVQNGVEADRCPKLVAENSEFVRQGGNGMVLANCDGARLRNLRFCDTGHAQVHIVAGDRRTLRSGGVCVTECSFFRSGRLQRTYTPAIRAYGFGTTIDLCTFADFPSSALRLEGNNHVVSRSVFKRTVLESDDQGAIDIYGDPTYRGTVVKDCTFVDVGGTDGNEHCGRCAIRFDDFISGMTVTGNTFVRAARGGFGAVQIHGGHYNAVVGNTFRDCGIGVSVIQWKGEKLATQMKWEGLASRLPVARDNPAFLRAYPEWARYGKDNAMQLLSGNTYENVPRHTRGATWESIVD